MTTTRTMVMMMMTTTIFQPHLNVRFACITARSASLINNKMADNSSMKILQPRLLFLGRSRRANTSDSSALPSPVNGSTVARRPLGVDDVIRPVPAMPPKLLPASEGGTAGRAGHVRPSGPRQEVRSRGDGLLFDGQTTGVDGRRMRCASH